MNNISVIAGVATFVVSMLGFFIAVRVEIKKQSDQLLKARLEEERRHSLHERRLAIIEQQIRNIELGISSRLDMITRTIKELHDLYISHINGRHIR